jgi:hypothetical protein
MKKIIMVLAGITLGSACSDAGERRTLDEELSRPLEVARVDTTQPLAPVEHATSRDDSVTMPKPRKAKRQPKRPAAAPDTAPRAPVAQEDTTVMGYAPETSSKPAPDSAPSAAADTVPLRDTIAAPAPDTAARPAPDTLAVRTSDTASTTTDDSIVGRNTPQVTRKPATAAATAAHTLPIGTEIHAALDDSINSRTDTTGRVVTAVVMNNVTGSDGRTLIPAGAPVRFTVTRLRAARSKSAQGRLALQVEGVGLGGELRKVSADVRPVPHELRGRGVGTSEAAKVGVGAAGGAVLGRVIGGNTKGAVIGGVVGAAGGAVVASQTATRDVVVKARTPVTFVLTQPLVAPEQPTNAASTSSPRAATPNQ